MRPFRSLFKSLLIACAPLLIILLASWASLKKIDSGNLFLTKTLPDNNLNKVIDLKEFPVLCISKKDIEDLFKKRGTEPNVYKLVFAFNLNDTKPYNPSLSAFRAKKNNREYITKTYTTLERTKTTCTITGEYTLGNLELSKKYYDKTLKISTGYANAKSLLFYPIRNATTYEISYSLYWSTDDCTVPPPACDPVKNSTGPVIFGITFTGNLNPSPPANAE